MNFSGNRVFFVGLKGSGMAHLAILLKTFGASVTGCDVAQRFTTDEQLEQQGITALVGFDPSLLDCDADFVIHSSAYAQDLPIMAKARDLGLPLYSYPQFLAYLSTLSDSYAVAGTHGKTSTVAIASYLFSQGKVQEFPVYSLFGSTVQGQSMPLCQGSEIALFEACEYQDHFLSYQIRGALVTNIELDHPDYFCSVTQVHKSFEAFVDGLAPGGFLLYCSDDPGAKSLGSYARLHRPDLTLMSYGFDDSGPFRIMKDPYQDTYRLSCLDRIEFSLPVNQRALVANHVGAAVLCMAMILDRKKPKLYLEEGALITTEAVPAVLSMLLNRLTSFPGVVGRCERIPLEDEVLYFDDYAHHPTEIVASLEELRFRYPMHPILVIFAPHTASRTKAFLKEFVDALAMADRLIIQRCYASAREDSGEGEDMGKVLSTMIGKKIMRTTRTRLQANVYSDSDEETVGIACGWLQPQDLCITMGAGNNRPLSARIAQARRSLP